MTHPPAAALGPRVAVAGAGVLGLLCAWRLARRGARVTVYEAAADRPNASRVAAGMIAPATECALEPALRELAAALQTARAAWAELASELGVGLCALGAEHAGPRPLLQEREALLRGLGFSPSWRASAADGALLFTPEDAALCAAEALSAMRRAAEAAGAAFRDAAVERGPQGVTAAGERVETDVLVLATGAGGRACGLAPELDRLTPIKGQLLRWRGAASPRPILRTPGLYLVAAGHDLVVGATMQVGRDDLEPEPALLAPLRAEAERRLPALRRLAAPAIDVGVRADTPDGLPMAGPSREPGVVLATGARRNGWLWAPPIASIVEAEVFGLPLGELAPLAERLHPKRFTTGEAR